MQRVEENVYFDFLRNRRSIRKYLPKDVPRELIDRVLDAARWAPSAHNAQPWRFVILTERTDRERLAKAMAERFRQDLEQDGLSGEMALQRAEESVARFSASPVIVVACVDMKRMDRYADAFRQKAEEMMATQSLAAALQNLLLGASALGLGGCWFCAPLFCPEVVRNTLSIPGHYHPQALITLGYPDEAPTPPQRLQLHEIRKIL